METERHDEVTHAPDLAPSGFVLGLLAAMIVISVALCVVAYVLLGVRESALRPGRAFPEHELGAPQERSGIRQAPFASRPAVPLMRERQRVSVGSYGWVDRERRVVSIPVERAMQLLVDRAAAGGQP